jgi:hypothetical protein
VSLKLIGQSVSTNQVRDLVDTLNQAYRDGYRISIIR